MTTPLKILFNTYPMAFHTPGGGEIQIKAYEHYLKQRNVKVGLFDLWDPHFLSYDIMHFFSVMGGSIPFCHFTKQLKLPLAITTTLWVTHETTHLYPCDEIRQQLTFADKAIVNSKIEGEQLTKVLGIPSEKMAVVYNGVDPIFFEPTPAEIFRRHYGIDFPFILNVANIEPRKNQINLLQAMKQFKDHKLITIGHMRDKAYGRECLEVGGGQFMFLGPIAHDNPLLRSAYAACDVFALPSTLETPGLAALEAAAQGAHLAVTGVGAPREYFGEDAHYVDNPQDPDEIAQRINEALQSSYKGYNQNLAQRIQDNFSWEKVIDSLINVYHDMKKCSIF